MEIVMSENYIYRVKYHITFESGDRYGSWDFDMDEVSSEEEAEQKIVELYEVDEFNLVDGELELGDTCLEIDECSKITLNEA